MISGLRWRFRHTANATLNSDFSRSFDRNHGIECSLVVCDRIDILRICTPGSVNDELVLVDAGGELDGGTIKAVSRLICHFLAGRVPIVEFTGEVNGFTAFGMDGKDNIFLFRLFGAFPGGFFGLAFFCDFRFRALLSGFCLHSFSCLQFSWYYRTFFDELQDNRHNHGFYVG